MTLAKTNDRPSWRPDLTLNQTCPPRQRSPHTSRCVLLGKSLAGVVRADTDALERLAAGVRAALVHGGVALEDAVLVARGVGKRASGRCRVASGLVSRAVAVLAHGRTQVARHAGDCDVNLVGLAAGRRVPIVVAVVRAGVVEHGPHVGLGGGDDGASREAKNGQLHCAAQCRFPLQVWCRASVLGYTRARVGVLFD
jgi:hypothetical protein